MKIRELWPVRPTSRWMLRATSTFPTRSTIAFRFSTLTAISSACLAGPVTARAASGAPRVWRWMAMAISGSPTLQWTEFKSLIGKAAWRATSECMERYPASSCCRRASPSTATIASWLRNSSRDVCRFFAISRMPKPKRRRYRRAHRLLLHPPVLRLNRDCQVLPGRGDTTTGKNGSHVRSAAAQHRKYLSDHEEVKTYEQTSVHTGPRRCLFRNSDGPGVHDCR